MLGGCEDAFYFWRDIWLCKLTVAGVSECVELPRVIYHGKSGEAGTCGAYTEAEIEYVQTIGERREQ